MENIFLLDIGSDTTSNDNSDDEVIMTSAVPPVCDEHGSHNLEVPGLPEKAQVEDDVREKEYSNSNYNTTSSVYQKAQLSDMNENLTKNENDVTGNRIKVKTVFKTNEEMDMAWFSLLPTEILQHIFNFLSTNDLCVVSSVCRQWNTLAMDPIYWQKIKIKHHLNIEDICSILSRMPLLKELNLQGLESLKADGLKQILLICPQITILNLGFIPEVGRDIMLTISGYLPKIEELNIEGSQMMDTNGVSALLHLKSLTVLNISHCTALYDFHVLSIVSNLPYLRNLNLDGISCVSDNTIKKIWQRCGSWLERLYLDGADMTDVGMEYLSHCSELKTFSLSFGENITDEGICHITHWKGLEELRMRKCINVSAEALEQVFSEAGCFSKLQSLDLSECLQLNDSSLIRITKTCKRLQHFTICWCWNLTDPGVSSILENCPDLVTLDLTGLDKIKGDNLADIPDKLPHLTMLDLRQCNQIHDVIISDVVAQMPNLIAYNYYGEIFFVTR